MYEFLLQDLENFWSNQIENFQPPTVKTHVSPYEIWDNYQNNGKAVATCAGAARTISLGGYCGNDHTIHIDIDGIDRLVENVAKNSNMDGDSAALLVVAHEYAHGVQNFVGLQSPNPYHELQADCMAGYYFHYAVGNSLSPHANDLDEFGTALIKLGDYNHHSSDHHGIGMRRLNAFMAGIQGNGETCIEANF